MCNSEWTCVALYTFMFHVIHVWQFWDVVSPYVHTCTSDFEPYLKYIDKHVITSNKCNFPSPKDTAVIKLHSYCAVTRCTAGRVLWCRKPDRATRYFKEWNSKASVECAWRDDGGAWGNSWMWTSTLSFKSQAHAALYTVHVRSTMRPMRNLAGLFFRTIGSRRRSTRFCWGKREAETPWRSVLYSQRWFLKATDHWTNRQMMFFECQL